MPWGRAATFAVLIGVFSTRVEAQTPRQVVIFGAPMSCAAAVEFRDGTLVRQWDAAVARYKESQAAYDEARAMFEKRVEEARKRWSAALDAEKKKIAADLIIMSAGLAAKNLLAKVPDTLTAIDKAGIKLAVGQLEKSAKLPLASANEITAGRLFADFGYPVILVIAGMVAPATAPVAAAATIILKAVDFGTKAFNVWVLNFSAQKEFTMLADFITRVTAKAPRTEVIALNRIKNEIDMQCGGR